MTNNSITFQKLADELTRLEVALSSAKQTFLDVEEHYATIGVGVEKEVRLHVSRYIEPNEDRARFIREKAQEVVENLRLLQSCELDS